MKNAKRKIGSLISRRKTYRLNRRHISDMEKIILKYIKPADHYIEIGKAHSGHTARCTSIRYLPHINKFVRHLTIHTQAPNVFVIFTPWSTEIRVQRAYDTGNDLMGVNTIFVELSAYFDMLENNDHSRRRFMPNRISLN
jgi:hypothetical protein